LVFVGDISGKFRAMDAESGKILWEVSMATATDGFPITYAVAGKQYLAVPTGPGWFLGWQQVQDFFPEVKRPPASGTAIHVYALAEE
jgi:alcohol dehydrogenase (cytochrome c)